jgi:dephospho-CoA kinase
MTRIIGLTGGIGSGKSTVARFFIDAGIPVYFADEASREIASTAEVSAQIRKTFGDKFFNGGKLDRQKLAACVFSDPAALETLNAIIHPAVRNDFSRWLAGHRARPWVVREAAILFESGSDADCDIVITVTAPVELRILRVMERDGIGRDEVLARMSRQWTDAQREAKSDFVVENVEIGRTQFEISQILKKVNNL